MHHTLLFVVSIVLLAVVGAQFDDASFFDSIPGEPGTDYPIFHTVPRTGFTCAGKIAGFYADVEARCQVWHYCSQDGLVDSFLCNNGTIFSQESRVCQWWYDVDCAVDADRFLDVNKDLYIVPESATAN